MQANPAGPAIKGRQRPYQGEETSVNFLFACWNCEEDNVLWGNRVGFWGTRFEVDLEWDCWCCGASNITHDPPWVQA